MQPQFNCNPLLSIDQNSDRKKILNPPKLKITDTCQHGLTFEVLQQN